jgi:zinc transport system substrate-binding protein
MRRRLIPALLALSVMAGCGAEAAGTTTDGKVDVVTAFYPLQYLSERIGGDRVAVTNLTKPGAEPHDVELNPQQVGQIADAGLVVYLSGFQPAVDKAAGQEAKNRSFDVASAVELLPIAAHDEHEETPGEEHAEATGGKDPHVWLDPVRFATITDRLGERLATVDPAHAADYRARAATVLAELDAQARSTGATTIFFETLVSPKVAETIAREVGARTAVLDPLEGLTEPGSDYISVMRANLAALTGALGCTS